MKRLLLTLVAATALLGSTSTAFATHAECFEEAAARTEHARFGCEQMPSPPVNPR